MVRKRGRLERAACLLLAAMAASGCAVKAASNVKYPAEQCRRVRLINSSSGEAVVGVEDLALDRRRGRLFLSAYDRHAVAKAVRNRAFSVPEGGVYEISFARLTEGDETTMEIPPMVRRDEAPGGLRPVGISYDPDTDELAFVNRGYQKIDEKWSMTARVHRVGSDGEVYIAEESSAPCNANNIVAEKGDLLVSFDHGYCGWRGKIEEALAMKTSGVADGDGRALFSNAAYANGLARTHKGDVVLAATRESALILLDRTTKGLGLLTRIPVEGGPDNVTIADDGGIVAAVHPSMMRIGLNRMFGIGKAPSRVIKVDPDSGASEVLFDDPSGALFSAATVAVESKSALVLGSVTDEGLLVCKGSA